MTQSSQISWFCVKSGLFNISSCYMCYQKCLICCASQYIVAIRAANSTSWVVYVYIYVYLCQRTDHLSPEWKLFLIDSFLMLWTACHLPIVSVYVNQFYSNTNVLSISKSSQNLYLGRRVTEFWAVNLAKVQQWASNSNHCLIATSFRGTLN